MSNVIRFPDRRKKVMSCVFHKKLMNVMSIVFYKYNNEYVYNSGMNKYLWTHETGEHFYEAHVLYHTMHCLKDGLQKKSSLIVLGARHFICVPKRYECCFHHA